MKLIANRKCAARPRGALDAGSAIVEFALAAPILIILVLGTADYASLANDTMNLRAATRGAAEYAQAYPTASGATVASYGNFPAGVTPTVSTVCICTDNSVQTCPAAGVANPCRAMGDPRVIQYVRVSATQTFTPWFSYADFAFPSSLSASTSLRFK